MYKALVASAGFAALVAGAPAASSVAGYTDADAGFPQQPSPIGSLATSFGPDSQVSAIATAPPSGSESGAAPPRVSSVLTGPTSHGPFSGTPTTTGAAKAPTTLGTAIPVLPPNPTATYYNTKGVPLNPMPIPYTPAGTFPSTPVFIFHR